MTDTKEKPTAQPKTPPEKPKPPSLPKPVDPNVDNTFKKSHGPEKEKVKTEKAKKVVKIEKRG